MKRINKYKSFKFKVKADTFLNFAKTLKYFEYNVDREKMIPYFHDLQQGGKITLETGRKIDDVFSVLAHFGIVEKNRGTINTLDKEFIDYIAISLENSLSSLIILNKIEFNNVSSEYTTPFIKIFSQLIDSKVITKDDLIFGARDWIRAPENKCRNYQKETATLFLLQLQLFLHYHGYFLDANQLAAFESTKSEVFKLKKLTKHKTATKFENSIWLMGRQNAKNRVERHELYINYNLIYSSFQLTEAKIYNSDPLMVSDVEAEEEIEFKISNKIKNKAKEKFGYKCYFNSDHETFISKTGEPYMHYHHILFKSLSHKNNFFEGIDLDEVNNLIPLCPTCHTKIHHGRPADNKDLIDKLFSEIEKRDIKATKLKPISKKEFYKIYGFIENT